MITLMREVHKNFYEDIFLTAELNDKFSSFAEWEAEMKNASMEDFKQIDVNRLSSPAVAEKIDAIGEKIFKKVKLAVQQYDPIDLFFTKQKGEIGKKVTLQRSYGGRAYMRTYGGILRVSPIVTESLTIETNPYGVHFDEPVEKFQTGVLNLADLVVNAARAVLRYKVGIALGVLFDAYAAGDSSYRTDEGSTPIDQAGLDDGVKKVADKSDDINIVGRRSVLYPILGFTGYADPALEEIRKTGWLGRYKGSNVLGIRDFADKMYDYSPIPQDKMMVIAKQPNAAVFVEAAPLKRSTWIDPATKRFHFVVDIEDGAAIWDLEYGHYFYNITP